MSVLIGVWVFICFVTWGTAAIASLSIIIEAFGMSRGWGFVVAFVPFGYFAFVVIHWRKTAQPFLISVVAGTALTLEIALGGAIKSLLAS